MSKSKSDAAPSQPPVPNPSPAEREGKPVGTGTPLTKQPLAPSSGQSGAKKG